LSRKKGQSIVVGDQIEIFISSIDGDQVKVGIMAPSDTKIYRREVFEAIKATNREAASQSFNVDMLKEIIQSEE
jgi:carbon storage regulator